MFFLACLPLPLHIEMAEDATSVSFGQFDLGIPEVWTLNTAYHHDGLGYRGLSRRMNAGM